MGACLLILGAWAASTRTRFEYMNIEKNVDFRIDLYGGQIVVNWTVYYWTNEVSAIAVNPPAQFRKRRTPWIDSWISRWGLQVPRKTTRSGTVRVFGWPYQDTRLTLPLWIPFASLAVPTIFLFWRDRRRTVVI